MRKVHRWLSVIFGLLILWITATGLLSQVGSLVNNRGFEEETAERGKRQMTALADAAVPPARAQVDAQDRDNPPASAPANAGQLRSSGFVCPADMSCRPKRTPKPGQWNLGFLHDLHSGANFGPVGVVLSLLSSLALIFFAFSGMWMYVQMYRARARNRGARGERSSLFW